MPSIFSIVDGPQYDIEAAYFCANNKDGTFGDLVRIPSVESVGVRLIMKSREARGDGRITALQGAVEKMEISLKNTGMNNGISDLFLDVIKYDYGTTPDRRRRVRTAARRTKYVGMAFKCSAGDEGDTHIFLPCLKLMSDIEWSFGYNEFVAPQMRFTGVGDFSLTDERGEPLMIDVIENETAEALVTVPFEWP